MKLKIVVLLAMLTAGCTSVDVKPVATSAKIQSVCIIENPKVAVSDFVSVLRDGFNRHGIDTSVVSEAAATSCQTTLTYTATRGWDLKPYMDHAELRLWQGGTQIGSADYNHSGGFGFSKFAGTKTKMDPVIDQLLGSRSGS